LPSRSIQIGLVKALGCGFDTDAADLAVPADPSVAHASN
jgi:hypothetical protein